MSKTQKCFRPFCARVHLRLTEVKRKIILWSDGKYEVLFGNPGRSSLQAKEERDHLAYHQCTAQKPASAVV